MSKVKTVHKVISRFRELGFLIVITGDKGHAEVTGYQVMPEMQGF